MGQQRGESGAKKGASGTDCKKIICGGINATFCQIKKHLWAVTMSKNIWGDLGDPKGLRGF